MLHALLPSLAAFLAGLGLLPGVIVVQDTGAAAGVWASVGSMLSANANIGTALTWAPTTTATLIAGDVGVCLVAKDESGIEASPGDLNEITGVADSAPNTWTKGGESCWAGNSAVANGACADIWYVKAGTTLTSGGTITFTFEAAGLSTSRSAATCWMFSAPGAITLLSPPSVSATATATAFPSLSFNTGEVREHLFIRATAIESNQTGIGTATTGYTSFDLTNAISNSGTTTSSTQITGEWRIATESTSLASQPPTSFTGADQGSIMIGLNQD